MDVVRSHVRANESIGCRVRLAILPNFGAGGILEQHIRIGIVQMSVLAHVTPVQPAVARKIVHQRHVDRHVGFACKIDIPNQKVALLPLSARGDIVAACGEITSLKPLFKGRQNVLVCIFGGAAVLTARV